MPTTLNLPSGSLLVEVILTSGVSRQVLFYGSLYDSNFKDISLFKLYKEDKTTGPVDFTAEDIQMLTVIDDVKYDTKSLAGTASYQITMKSGTAYNIHCFRIKKSSWIVGMLEDVQGLKKVFVNFEAVNHIKKISATIPVAPNKDDVEKTNPAADSSHEKPLADFTDSPFVKPEIVEFEQGKPLSNQDEFFRPLVEYINKHGIVDCNTLATFLNIKPSRRRHKVRLGDFLVREGFLSRENLDKGLAFRKSNRKLLLGEVLVELGYISEFVLALALAIQFRLPFTILDPEKVEKETAHMFSAEQAMEHQAIPFKLVNNRLSLAVANPGLENIQELSFILNKNISLVVASRPDIRESLTRFFGKQVDPVTSKHAQEFYFDIAGREEESVETIIARGKEAPIVSLVNQVINEGVERKASDIHITPEKKFIRLGYRVNGLINHADNLNKNVQSYLVARIKILAGMNIIERRLPQDGRIHGRTKNQTVVDIRVSILPSQHGETVVLRLRYPDKQQPDLMDLGFSKDHLALVKTGLTRSKGMVLVTGPTGSGKSTTLISFLNAVLDLPQKLHIITVEDPVELEVPGLTQIPVNSAIGMTFPRILRNILRHDPDVIMVGEIRDQETARVAVQAALTGHLVFSTLHTNDAITTLTRLEDMGIESFLVNTAVNMVIAQRLVKTLCDCAEPYQAETDDEELLTGFGIQPAAGQSLRRPKGCPKCGQTGYSGRAMIYELLLIDRDFRSTNLKEFSQSSEFQKRLAKKGFIPLIKHGLSKVVAGEVYLPEIMQHWEG